MANILKNDWKDLLDDEFNKEYYQTLRNFLTNEYKTKTIYPDKYDIFNALHFTSYKDIKVVILGQDPYHGPGQAHGLSFSVNPGIKIPPSLLNIYKVTETKMALIKRTISVKLIIAVIFNLFLIQKLYYFKVIKQIII